MSTATISLTRLAEVAGVSPRTAVRWVEQGLVPATNFGRGRGRGHYVTRAAAFEVLSLALSRRAGISLQRLRPFVRDLRRAGKGGRDFCAVGVHGRALLVDGAGDAAPLRDPRTGQHVLPLVLDLRTQRQAIEALIDELAK